MARLAYIFMKKPPEGLDVDLRNVLRTEEAALSFLARLRGFLARAVIVAPVPATAPRALTPPDRCDWLSHRS
jgi:hypothetical protein